MRDIVKGNEGLNISLNQIVNYELNKTLDDMISIIDDWSKHSDTISCDTVIKMLEQRKEEV